ncbi:MAG: carbohydrate kinase family protein [Pseudomonadota bacterium]
MKSLHIGSAMIDIITLVASENIERATFSNDGKSFLMLEAGRKLVAEQITSHVGGGACNTAVSLARRGWHSGVLAKVGDDLNAAEIRQHLAENDVADRLMLSDRSTGTAVMVASHDRNASIFVHRGANETLDCAEFPADTYADLDLIYVTSLSNQSADCFPTILQSAKDAGAMTAANPGIRQLTSRTAEFLNALAHVDLLSVNTVEAEALVPAFAPRAEGPDPVLPDGAPPLARRGLSFGGFEMGVIRFLRAVQAAGPRWVSLTDGTDGAYLATPDGVLWHPTVPAEVAGTAGAGDAFCSTLTSALVEGSAPETAMREAAINAASVVSHVDTTQGLLSRDALAKRSAGLGDLAPLRIAA